VLRDRCARAVAVKGKGNILIQTINLRLFLQVNVTILPDNPSVPDFGTTMIVLPAAFDADVAVGTLIATGWWWW